MHSYGNRHLPTKVMTWKGSQEILQNRHNPECLSFFKKKRKQTRIPTSNFLSYIETHSFISLTQMDTYVRLELWRESSGIIIDNDTGLNSHVHRTMVARVLQWHQNLIFKKVYKPSSQIVKKSLWTWPKPKRCRNVCLRLQPATSRKDEQHQQESGKEKTGPQTSIRANQVHMILERDQTGQWDSFVACGIVLVLVKIRSAISLPPAPHFPTSDFQFHWSKLKTGMSVAILKCSSFMALNELSHLQYIIQTFLIYFFCLPSLPALTRKRVGWYLNHHCWRSHCLYSSERWSTEFTPFRVVKSSSRQKCLKQ